MYGKAHTFALELAQIHTEAEAWALLLRFTDDLGMSHVHTWFGSRLEEMTFNSTCPDWWMPHYVEHGFIEHDDLARHCMTASGPRPYGVDRHGRCPHGGEDTERILNFMKESIGLACGVGFPVFLPGGRRIGGVNLGLPGTLETLDEFPASDLLAGMMAATAAHTRIWDLRDEIAPPRALSPRESDCLLLLAAGLRTKDISERLKISDATTTFHLNNAKAKLGADTREQAVARAVVLGLITP